MKKYFLLLLLLVMSAAAAGFTISKVEFRGNDLFDEEQLRTVIISYEGMDFDQKTVLEDAERLSDFYERQGYYLAKILLPQSIPQRDDLIGVVFEIEEGSDIRIDNFILKGNLYLSDEYIFGNLRISHNYLRQIPELMSELTSIYNDQGFYFAAVEVTAIVRNNDDGVDLELEISEGEYCRFSNAEVRGNEVTLKETVLQLARLQNRSKISPAELKQAEQKLIARPYINDCGITPLDAETLLYEIDEGAMTALEALLGYDNNADSNSRWQGYVNLNFENLWGTDRSAGFFWENRQEQHTSIELRYHESGWNIPVGGDFYLFREEMDSTWVEVSFLAEAYWYDLFNKFGGYLERQVIYPGARRPEIIKQTEFTKAGMLWKSSSLDNQLNPAMGSETDVKYYYIWSDADGEKSGRQAVEFRYFGVLPIYNRWVLAAEVNANVIENKDLTDFDIFYLGGAKSLRGYLEKQFSGYQVGWLNLEARYLLSRTARMSLNTDMGYYKRKNGDDELLFSIGGGLRVPTPIGLLSFDIALPVNEDGFGDVWDGIVHFGLETRF